MCMEINDRSGVNSVTTMSVTGSEVPYGPLSGNMTASIIYPIQIFLTINMFKTICICHRKAVSLDLS